LLIGAGERRAAELLARVDQAIATQSKLALGRVLSEPDVLPAPTSILDHSSDQEGFTAQQVRPRVQRHRHSFDSGIGSSIAGSTDSADAKPSTGEHMQADAGFGTCADRGTENTSVSTSATEQSFSGISAASEERGLSQYAADQIHKYIVLPILKEETLKEFHPLIKDVPNRIGNKEIKNLRELEKTLIFLAPVSERVRVKSNCAFAHGCSGLQDYSLSPSKYLRFCERTIRVLHTTVTTLHESDQRAPADRPYTQGYFFDLVEQVRLGRLSQSVVGINFEIQIRRYATILAATREKQTKGEKLDQMDYSR